MNWQSDTIAVLNVIKNLLIYNYIYKKIYKKKGGEERKNLTKEPFYPAVDQFHNHKMNQLGKLDIWCFFVVLKIK